jgi:hypothetical protein
MIPFDAPEDRTMSFFEQPLLIGLTGLLLISVLVAVWSQIGGRIPLIAAGVVLLATAGMLVVERFVETERERVVRTLHEIAETVATGEVSDLLAYAHSSASDVRRQVETEFHLYQIEEVRITRVWDVEILSDRQPHRAIVRLNVSVRGGRAQADLGIRRVVRFVEVTFEKEGEDWKVIAYEHDDPQRPLQRSP